jgi:hypothetical protein
MFWFAENLAKQSLAGSCLPWEFTPSAPISAQVRGDKQARQNWYQNAATKHNFYTALEPANPNMRPSKDNPVRAIHAFAVDYDVKIPPARVTEVIGVMKFKPQWIERSLGGNVRLVWLLPRPLMVDSNDFCSFVLERAVKWLDLELLPGLDENAFTTTTRLLCNGGEWQETKEKPISESALQAFFVACGTAFRFVSNDPTLVPLDVAEAEIKKKYPHFSWPSDFTADSQGPSFWIPESASPMSAILKPEGFITFSAHAVKPFYSWSDILGAEFVHQFTADGLAKATTDIFWDQKRFWRKKNDVYVSMEMAELTNYLTVNCRISNKPGSSGTSPMQVALNHIYNSNHIFGAAPFVMRPTGLIDFMGRRTLNTYKSNVMPPAEGNLLARGWGEGFPFLAHWHDHFFNPASQLPFFLAWFKHFYTSALTMNPMPGQNIFLMGDKNLGKTLMNRAVIGAALGGFVDATSHLIEGAQFNSEMYEVPLWSVDDETAGESETTRANFQAMLKKTAANQTFKYHKKFEIPVTVEWMGRVCCTTNMDFVSSRLLGPMDNTSADKTCLFRCGSHDGTAVEFPTRAVLGPQIQQELPYFLRWLLNWEPPQFVTRDVRYGYAAFHEPTLLEQAQQGSRSAPFKELLIESLLEYFEMNPEAQEWSGRSIKLLRLLLSNPLNETALRSIRLEQTNRYLEQIQREGLLTCSTATGEFKERIWIFKRPVANKPTT